MYEIYEVKRHSNECHPLFYFISFTTRCSRLTDIVIVHIARVCVCVCMCVHIYAYKYTQDEFISSVTRDKEVEAQAMRAEQDKLKLRHTFSKVLRGGVI